MKLKTISIYLLVMGISAVMAYAVFAGLSKDPTDEDSTEGDVHDPLWYRTASLEVRENGLRARLDVMTSAVISAAEAGPVKDEIALLCRDEAIVDLVVQSFADRKDLSSSELSAYMEIFARVRHEKFGPLVAEGIKHPRFEPKLNSFDAAIVQRHPSTARFIGRALPELTGYLATRAIAALTHIGTDEAVEQIIEALDHDDHDLVIHALQAVVLHSALEALPRLEEITKREDPEIRITAAWAMAALGRSRGRKLLEAAARDLTTTGSQRAQAIQFIGQLPGRPNTALLEDLAEDEDDFVAFESQLCLVRLRDQEILAELRNDVESDEFSRRRRALAMYASSGHEEDLELVNRRLDDLADDEIKLFMEALKRGQAKGAAEFVRRIAERDDAIGVAAISRFHDFGDRGVAMLRLIYDERKNDEKLGHLISAGGSIETTESLAFLESIDVGNDRRLWLFLRGNIRKIELALLKE